MTVYTGPFSEIPPFSYNLIMADPPWSFKTWSKKGGGKGAAAQYYCASLEEIVNLRVADLAAPDCLLWLWTTNPMLPKALFVMQSWGFTFKTAGHWSKRNPKTNKQAFGTGYIFRIAGEPYLIGTIGSPKTTNSVRSVIEEPRREHSRKPDIAFEEAEKLMPGAKRIELFSRQPRDGWDTWGDEAEKFA